MKRKYFPTEMKYSSFSEVDEYHAVRNASVIVWALLLPLPLLRLLLQVSSSSLLSLTDKRNDAASAVPFGICFAKPHLAGVLNGVVVWPLLMLLLLLTPPGARCSVPALLECEGLYHMVI